MKQPEHESRRSAKADVNRQQPTAEPEVDPEVLAVIREEQSRGRRPVDIAEKKRQEEQRLMVLKIYRRGTEQQLRQFIANLGLLRARSRRRQLFFAAFVRNRCRDPLEHVVAPQAFFGGQRSRSLVQLIRESLGLSV